MRADARRNRERLLDAAATAFAELGLDVSVAEIARRAGVGQGTLFRRFLTKADLMVAILVERLGELRALAEAQLEEPDPWAALRGFMVAGAEMRASDLGFVQAASPLSAVEPELWRRYLEIVLAGLRPRCGPAPGRRRHRRAVPRGRARRLTQAAAARARVDARRRRAWAWAWAGAGRGSRAVGRRRRRVARRRHPRRDPATRCDSRSRIGWQV
jgi:AcrR family transcriptional regulator